MTASTLAFAPAEARIAETLFRSRDSEISIQLFTKGDWLLAHYAAQNATRRGKARAPARAWSMFGEKVQLKIRRQPGADGAGERAMLRRSSTGVPGRRRHARTG